MNFDYCRKVVSRRLVLTEMGLFSRKFFYVLYSGRSDQQFRTHLHTPDISFLIGPFLLSLCSFLGLLEIEKKLKKFTATLNVISRGFLFK